VFRCAEVRTDVTRVDVGAEVVAAGDGAGWIAVVVEAVSLAAGPDVQAATPSAAIAAKATTIMRAPARGGAAAAIPPVSQTRVRQKLTFREGK
jgi:hypothetical protein